jgi:alpha,alpha-trehalase
MNADGYPPIGEYAFLSDCHTGALLGPDGSVEWLPAPRFDSESLFARMLDRKVGGAWELEVEGAGEPERQYLDSTLVLESRWQAPQGAVVAHDFLALKTPTGTGGAISSAGVMVRLVRCESGSAEIGLRVEARPEYGRRAASWNGGGDALIGDDGAFWLSGEPGPTVSGEDGCATVRKVLRAGDAAVMALGYRGGTHRRIDRTAAEAMLSNTIDAWRAWARRSDYDGYGAKHVHRSALVLRGLMFEETGALLAAPTTSLPEWIGGVRNWDYRFVWHRDASLLILSLLRLGHHEEAGRFLHFLIENDAHADDELEPMLGIGGETEMPEIELDHLEGYRGSAPVRIGNKAREQVQIDGYGQVLDAAYAYHQVTGALTRDDIVELRKLVDMACERWREPDHGKWEIRDEGRHWIYTKLFAWVCVERGVRIAEMCGDPEAPVDRWLGERDAIRRELLDRGYDPGVGAFTQTYGSRNLDSSVLRLPLVGFIDGDDPRMLSTLDRLDEELGEGGFLLHRYDPEKTDDGVGGPEGPFLLSSFEMVSALLLAGRPDEAKERFEQICARGGRFGLFAEQMQEDGTMLGNYPQAFSHLGLINAATNLDEAGRRDALHDWAGGNGAAKG